MLIRILGHWQKPKIIDYDVRTVLVKKNTLFRETAGAQQLFAVLSRPHIIN